MGTNNNIPIYMSSTKCNNWVGIAQAMWSATTIKKNRYHSVTIYIYIFLMRI